MPKTLTGAELRSTTRRPATPSNFLVDGNNLPTARTSPSRGAGDHGGLPDERALGFTNMLFKLLSDYRPKGVAVAWDTSPVHCKELSPEYKIERRPMPDLLREQFPHFRPIVEAFGYVNLEFEVGRRTTSSPRSPRAPTRRP